MSTQPKLKPVCAHCGSDDVRRDASCAWNVDTQEWEIVCVYDNADCEACEGETKLDMIAV